MKKSEFYSALFEKKADLLICPVCGQNVKINQKSIICQKGHCFDFSSRGSINLCYPQKSSSDLYTDKLFSSRRAVFSAGFFDVIINEVRDIIKKHSPCDATVADVGSGEGSFLRKLIYSSSMTGIAMDISKQAIASGVSQEIASILWIVADLSAIPLCSSSVDVIINVLSPSNYLEFKRVTKPGGLIIKVVPAEKYLSEFRTILRKDLEYSNSGTVSLFKNAFAGYSSKRICYEFETNEVLTEIIFDMTPLSDKKHFDDYAELRALKKITLDYEILSFVLNEG